jgi:hypothetical protein
MSSVVYYIKKTVHNYLLYSWEMTFKIDLNVYFDNMQDRKGIQWNVGEFNGWKCVTNYEAAP